MQADLPVIEDLIEVEAEYRRRLLVLTVIHGLPLLTIFSRQGVEDILASGMREDHVVKLYSLDGVGLQQAMAEVRQRGLNVRWDDFVEVNGLRSDYLAVTHNSIPIWLDERDKTEADDQVRELAALHCKSEAEILADWRWSSAARCMLRAVPEDLV